jgi:uncharacterized membrane protein required for colicin V production
MDVLLVGFVAALTFGGWRTGLIHRLAGLAFTAIAFVAGAYVRGPFGSLIAGFFPSVPPAYAELLGYAFGFPIILAIIHIAAYPFIKDHHLSGVAREIDKGLGAAFGFIEGVLILSVLVVIFDTYFATSFPNYSGSAPGLGAVTSLVSAFNSSYTVQLLRDSTVPLVLALLGPLLPKDISSLAPTGTPGLPGLPGIPGLPGQRSPKP